MSHIVYHRQARTPYSEQYEISDGERRIGHLDVHFGGREVYGTLVLDQEMSEEDLTGLIENIDENIVLSSDVPRDDFLVRVYAGKELGLYSDELLRDDYLENGLADLDNDE